MGESVFLQDLQDRVSQPLAAGSNYISSGISTRKLYSRLGNFTQSQFTSELTKDRHIQLFPDNPERAWLAACLEQRHPMCYLWKERCQFCREAGAVHIVWDQTHLLITGRCSWSKRKVFYFFSKDEENDLFEVCLQVLQVLGARWCIPSEDTNSMAATSGAIPKQDAESYKSSISLQLTKPRGLLPTPWVAELTTAFSPQLLPSALLFWRRS